MGFKEHPLLNDSLLAKQTWRLLYNKNSLFYRIFKSKIFPNCSIMEAREGRGGSYAWKSILHGREVIRRGAKWRVGNGESIKVWGDNWLPSLSHPRIQGPLTTEMQEAKVISLINPITHQWKSTLISSAFNQDVCELIQQIQLSKTPAEDALFWSFVQSSNYSAKSGYFFLKQEVRMLATPSQQPVDPSITAWEKIWNLSVPCKVRNFIWRSCRNAIPTKTNLVRKCVIDESRCTQCHDHQEDVLHTLWYCPNLSQVWDSDPQWNFRGQTSFGNFQQLLSYVL